MYKRGCKIIKTKKKSQFHNSPSEITVAKGRPIPNPAQNTCRKARTVICIKPIMDKVGVRGELLQTNMQRVQPANHPLMAPRRCNNKTQLSTGLGCPCEGGCRNLCNQTNPTLTCVGWLFCTAFKCKKIKTFQI